MVLRGLPDPRFWEKSRHFVWHLFPFPMALWAMGKGKKRICWEPERGH